MSVLVSLIFFRQNLSINDNFYKYSLKIALRVISMSEIKVYSTPTCPWCHRMKDFLKEKGVEFVDLDVAADDTARNEMIEKSGQMGVPQIEINGKMIVGFDQEAIEAELAEKSE